MTAASSQDFLTALRLPMHQPVRKEPLLPEVSPHLVDFSPE